MSVRTTSVCEAQITAIDAWWRDHRPSLGRPWTSTEVPGVRRVVMRATQYHVYYREDEDGVVMLAVWSALRATQRGRTEVEFRTAGHAKTLRATAAGHGLRRPRGGARRGAGSAISSSGLAGSRRSSATSPA